MYQKIFNFKFRNQLLKEKQQQVNVWYSRDIPVRMLCTSHAEFFKTAQSFQLLFEWKLSRKGKQRRQFILDMKVRINMFSVEELSTIFHVAVNSEGGT